jgi:restriction endonuclease S subunit
MNITDKGQFIWDGLKQIALSEYEGKENYALRSGDVLFNNTNSKELVGKTCFIENDIHGGFSNHMTRIRVKPGVCAPNFLALLLHNAWKKGIFLELANRWVGQAGINATALAQFQIPLPPLEVQKEIVAEIEGYQKVINGARAVLDHYRPHIPIHPDWPMVELSASANFISGYAFKSTDMTAMPMDATYRRVVKIGNVGRDGQIDIADAQFHAYSEDLARFVLRVGDVVMAMTGATVGKVAVVKEEGFLLNQRVGVLRAKSTALQSFVFHLLCSDAFYDFCQRTAGGGAQGNIAPREILEYQIPLPPLATQQAIVAEIVAEQALVAANRELITRFEKKIQATLARVWGEEGTGVAEGEELTTPDPS